MSGEWAVRCVAVACDNTCDWLLIHCRLRLLFGFQNFNDENAQCSQDDVEDFLNTTQSYMDSSSFVERYAWFGAMENLQGVNTVRIFSSSPPAPVELAHPFSRPLSSWSPHLRPTQCYTTGQRAHGLERRYQRSGRTIYRWKRYDALERCFSHIRLWPRCHGLRCVGGRCCTVVVDGEVIMDIFLGVR